MAQYLAEKLIHDSLQQAIDAINADRTMVDFGAALVGTLTAETLVGPFIATAAAGLFSAATSGDLTHFQDAVEDPLLLQRIRCALQTGIGSDGGVTSGNFAAISAAVAGVSYANADVVTAIGDFITNMGADGLIAVQQLGGLEAGACAPCSTWCKVWDFKISQYSWFATDGAWGGAGVGYGSAVVVGHDQCTVGGGGGDPTQFLDSIRIKGFAAGTSSNVDSPSFGRAVHDGGGTVLGHLPNGPGAFDVTIQLGGISPTVLSITCGNDPAIIPNSGGQNFITYISIAGSGTAPSDGVAC